MGGVPFDPSWGIPGTRRPPRDEFSIIQCNHVCCKCSTISHKTLREIFTDMSQFATTDTARAAGFPSIRAMRELFHSKAQVRLSTSLTGPLGWLERAAKAFLFLRLCMRRAVKETCRIRFEYVSYSASVANTLAECSKMSSGLFEPSISCNKPKSLLQPHKLARRQGNQIVGNCFRVAVSSEHNEWP